MSEHTEKYETLAHWLGVERLKTHVPFSAVQIRAALAARDEHLNTLALSAWDRQHGTPYGWVGVCALVRDAIKRDRNAGREPLITSWSLSQTVCVLKHVARYHIAR